MKQAFSLVELIVVITIMAMLFTIAFISIQEQTSLDKGCVYENRTAISNELKECKTTWLNIFECEDEIYAKHWCYDKNETNYNY